MHCGSYMTPTQGGVSNHMLRIFPTAKFLEMFCLDNSYLKEGSKLTCLENLRFKTIMFEHTSLKLFDAIITETWYNRQI